MFKSVCPSPGYRQSFTSDGKATAPKALISPYAAPTGILPPLKGSYMEMGHGSLLLVGPAKNHLSNGFFFEEILPNLTTSPNHHYFSALEPLPITDKSALSWTPFCLKLHYSTQHSSKETVTHNVKSTSLGKHGGLEYYLCTSCLQLSDLTAVFNWPKPHFTYLEKPSCEWHED